MNGNYEIHLIFSYSVFDGQPDNYGNHLLHDILVRSNYRMTSTLPKYGMVVLRYCYIFANKSVHVNHGKSNAASCAVNRVKSYIIQKSAVNRVHKQLCQPGTSTVVSTEYINN